MAHLVIIMDSRTQTALCWDIWSNVDSKRMQLLPRYAVSLQEASGMPFHQAKAFLEVDAAGYLAPMLKGIPRAERPEVPEAISAVNIKKGDPLPF